MYNHLTFLVLLWSLSKILLANTTRTCYFKLKLCFIPETVFIHSTQEQYISICLKKKHASYTSQTHFKTSVDTESPLIFPRELEGEWTGCRWSINIFIWNLIRGYYEEQYLFRVNLVLSWRVELFSLIVINWLDLAVK